MALPRDLREIATNLPYKKLVGVAQAVEADKVKKVPGSLSGSVGFFSWRVTWQGKPYLVEETLEQITAIYHYTQAFQKKRQRKKRAALDGRRAPVPSHFK